MLPMLLGIAVSIFIAFKNVSNRYHTDRIIIIGAATSLLGIVSTAVGINNALGFSNGISKIAPHIMINGIKKSLITTYFAGLSYWCQFCCGITLKISIALNIFKI